MNQNGASFQTRPDLQGTFGMSASTHWLATATAQSVLERGGNAFDAAVAAGFVLHIVEPHLNGPGGDLTALFVTGADKRPQVLMGQGPAPERATVEHFKALGLDLVPGAGLLAAAVPGAVEAWLLLLQDYGTWELTDILSYAIGYARNGHPLLERAATTIKTVAQLFRDHWPTSAARWMPDGKAPKANDLIRNEAYASVLERLINAGGSASNRVERIAAARMEWRQGFVADAIDTFARSPHWHSSGENLAGVIRASDMREFRASIEPALTFDFRGYTIAKTSAWGQGPVLLQTLAILDPLDNELLDPSTAVGAHTILEAQKLAFADREAYYGDTASVPLETLLSAEYATERRALIGPSASHQLRPGNAGNGCRMPFSALQGTPQSFLGKAALEGLGEPTIRGLGQCKLGCTSDTDAVADNSSGLETFPSGETRGDTCHLDIVDRWGNMISATPSGGWLQSSPTIPELGFCLGTRLQMNWLEEGMASTLAPGKRPRTTLTPTLVLRNGEPVVALGSPGGDQQDQWQLLYLLRTIVFGYTPQQAIDAPCLHSVAFPASFWPRTWEPGGAVVEDRLGDEVIAELEKRGHVVRRAEGWSLGRVSSVSRDPKTGIVSAAADARGAQSYAAGR